MNNNIIDNKAHQNCAEFFAISEGVLSRASFDQMLRAVFNGDWHATFPPPMLERKLLQEAGEAAQKMLMLVFSLPERVFNGDYKKMLAYQGVAAEMANYILPFLREPLLQRAQLFARPDILISKSGLKFMEMNVTTSLGGMGICNRYLNSLKLHPLASHLEAQGIKIEVPRTDAIWRQVFKRACPPLRENVQPTLLKLLPEAGQNPDDLFYAPDFVDMVSQLGYHTITSKPNYVKVSDDGVYVEGERIDVVFCDFMFSEQIEHSIPESLISSFVKLESLGKLHFLSSPPTCALFDNKANLAILTAPEFAHLFSDEELDLITRYIPPARVLSVDNFEFAVDKQSTLVLKPGLGLAGENITIGKNCSNQHWHSMLQNALATGRPYVLQELVEDVWRYHGVDGQDNSIVCLGAYVYDNEAAGVLVRLLPCEDGEIDIVNVARGACWAAAPFLRTEG